MPKSSQQPPANVPLTIVQGKIVVERYPTPNLSDRIYVRRMDARVEKNKIPPAVGSVYDGPDPKQLEGFVFATARPADQGGFVDWFYLNERANQDAYNFAIDYPYNDKTYPRITRTYVLLRDGLVEPQVNTVDPIYAGLQLTDHKQVRIADDPVLDSLFVMVQRVYEILPGPVITTKQENQYQQLVNIEEQEVADPSTVATPTAVTELAKTERTGTAKLKVTKGDTDVVFGQEEYTIERPDGIIPYKFQTLIPSVRFSQVVAGIASLPTLAAGQWRASEKQLTLYKKLVETVSHTLSAFVTLVGYLWTRDQQIATVTETWDPGSQTITPRATLIDAEVSNWGTAGTLLREVEVDSVFGEQEFMVEKSDSNIPARFQNIIPTTKISVVTAGTASLPTLGVGEIRKTERQVTLLKKMVETITRTLSVAVSLVGSLWTRDQQLATVTETWSPTTQTITPRATLIDAEVTDLGLEGSIMREVEVPRVFPGDIHRIERPDVTPEKFRAAILTKTEGEELAGNAVLPTLTVGQLAASEEQTTELKKRVSLTSRTDVGLPFSLAGKSTSGEQQEVTRTETLQLDSTPQASPTATTTVQVENLGDGRVVQTVDAVPRVFPESDFSIDVQDSLPPEFQAVSPTTRISITEPGTAQLPTLGAGELAKRETQKTELIKRTETTGRDLGQLPKTLVDQELTEAFGFGGVLDITRTVDKAPQTVDQGILVTASRVKNLPGGLTLKETSQIAGDDAHIDITNGGTSYETPPTISFSGGGAAGGGAATAEVSTIAPGDPLTTQLAHIYDGDDRGVFYYLGSYRNNGVWTNPNTAGEVNLSMTAGTLQSGTLTQLVDRQPSNVYTVITDTAFELVVDLGTNKNLICNKFAFQQRTIYNGNVNAFIFSGSNDGSTWTVLKDPPNTLLPLDHDQWKSYTIPGTTAYRYFRVSRPGVGPTDFTIGEIELYGALTITPASIGVVLTSITVTSPGAYITAPTVVITGGGGSGASAVAILDDHAVSKVVIASRGTGFTSAPSISFTGGVSGTAATAHAVIGKAVASVTVTSGGSGYSYPPAVRFGPVVSPDGVEGGGAVGVAVLGKGLGSINVTNSGAGYTSNPGITFTGGGGGSGALATAVRGFPVASVALVNGGTGFTVAPLVTLNGDGLGAAAHAVLGTKVGSVILTAGGSNYAAGVAAVFTPVGGAGSGAVGSVTRSFSVASATVTAGGSGFTSPPKVNFTAAGPGLGVTATAQLEVLLGAISVANGGSGYTSNPGITFTGGGGTGAVATASRSFGVASATVSAGGSGFVSAPAVVFAPPVGGGTTATGTSTLDGRVISATVTAGGSDYSSIPAVALTGTGTGATATAVMSSNASYGQTYISDGDANGVCYKLGALGNAGVWRNPHTFGDIVVTSANILGGTVDTLVDRLSSGATDVRTNGNNVCSHVVDLLSGRQLTCNKVTLRQSGVATSAGSQTLTSVNFEGSTDGLAWSLISTLTGISSANDAWNTFDITSSTPYRYFRINGVVAGRIPAGEIELYGTLTIAGTTGSVASVTVTAGGTGWTADPTLAFSGGTPSIAATGTATYTKQVASVAVTSAGSGYTSGPAVSFTGGSGTGAAGLGVLGTVGPVKAITLTSPGSGYVSRPAVVIATNAGGTGAAADVAISNTDRVGAIVITNGGSGYTSAPAINFTEGGGGVAASAGSTLATTGPIAGVAIVAGGSGYISAPAISFTATTGSGAVAFATQGAASGAISSIVVDSPGSGYTTAPAVVIAGGTSAAGTAALGTVGIVKQINVTVAGTGYTFAPNVVVASNAGGTLAAATGILNTSGVVTSVTVTHGGSKYTGLPSVEFLPGLSGGSGAIGAAVLAASGAVVGAFLDSQGSYLTPPIVTIAPPTSGVTATAIYVFGAGWAKLYETVTDAETGVVIKMTKEIVPAGTIYPGTGYVEIKALDKWRSIKITSELDDSSLPSPLISAGWTNYNFPSELISIIGAWSTASSSGGSGGSSNWQNSGPIIGQTQTISNSIRGTAIVNIKGGYNGPCRAEITRTYMKGPPAAANLPSVFFIQTSSGTVVVSGSESSSTSKFEIQGVTSTPNSLSYQTGFTETGSSLGTNLSVEHISNVLTGNYTVTNDVQPGGYLIVSLLPSTPLRFTSGETFIAEVRATKMRFDIWQVETVRITVP